MDIFAEERQKKILELLFNDGRVLVEDLVKEFKVSGVTIRRDLYNLCKNYDSVKRTHGGAIILSTNDIYWHAGQISINNNLKNPNEKGKQTVNEDKLETKTVYMGKGMPLDDRMVDFAVNFIENFDNIIIESSPLNAQMAKKIPKQLQIKIFTNGAAFISNIEKDSKWQCYIPEGEIDNNDMSIIGLRTNEFFKEVLVDKAFINIESLNNNLDFYSSTYNKKDIKKSIMHSAKKVIATYMYQENDLVLPYKVDNLNVVDILIIGGLTNKDMLDRIKKSARDTEIYTVV
jgi:DeoR family transcriptional regulator, aga operon transcriptional repressor